MGKLGIWEMSVMNRVLGNGIVNFPGRIVLVPIISGSVRVKICHNYR